MGLVIKSPKKAAAEYAKHSVSIYRHCPNMCRYCYLDKGISKGTLGSGTPELRTCFYNEDDAVQKFNRELVKNREQLIKDGGVFFCFITDPCLPDTINATMRCAQIAMRESVPVTILTKMTDWVYESLYQNNILEQGRRTGMLCVGFTLTGRDDQEPYASPNIERIKAMRIIHDVWKVKTFASIEPIIQFNKSLAMIRETLGFCDLYRIGLMSKCGKGYYEVDDAIKFIENVNNLLMNDMNCAKVYYKESIRKFTDYYLSLGLQPISVGSDFNIFTDL